MKKNIFNACKITTIVDFFILGKAIMFMLGEMIPKLKGRQSKGATADSGSGQSISANKKNKKKKKGKWTKTNRVLLWKRLYDILWLIFRWFWMTSLHFAEELFECVWPFCEIGA